MSAVLNRTTLRTSRLLDFASEKDLVAQTGHQTNVWPIVILKELVDNAIDAAEEAEIAPRIKVTVDWPGSRSKTTALASRPMSSRTSSTSA
jgi:hypothetical protein